VGTNLVIEWQFGGPDRRSLDHLAAELVRRRVEVIVTETTPAVLAAQRATREIPIVFIGIGDPVASGIVASLARPGGNATGTTVLGPELVPKRLELLMRILPKLTRVAYVFMADNSFYAISMKNLEAAARKAGVDVLAMPLKPSDDIERVFLAMKRERADAAIWSIEAFLPAAQLERFGALTIRHRVPAIGATPGFARLGGLMSYSVDEAELGRIAPSQVARILRGAKPADLPVVQSTRVVLAVNMKTARSLGIAIPEEILSRAEVVID
jgi:putative ABC transport system substrate-binding protein